MSVFGRFAPRLQEAIVARLGWTTLRAVQEEAGAALLDGHNAVVLAPTAGGKTEASMFPTLSQLVTDEPRGVGALYVAPIKALLNNQAERLGLYTEMVGLDRFVWHGDVGSHQRKKFLREPCALLMTTPESLEVMLVSQRVDAAGLFGDLRTVVIDEVHAMAGTDRGAHLMSVLERLAALSRHDVQRVGLSATVGNPHEILRWLQGTSQRAGVVVDPPKPPARRELLVVHRDGIEALVADAAAMARGKKSLFFCQSRAMTEAVAGSIRRSGTPVFVHHSAVSKEERELAEEKFHRGSEACIVCTSTLELGIDVGDLDRVLQAEAPDTVSSFLQRMGRTGRRAGQAANTTFFCETTEGVLQAIALVELAREGWVEAVEVNPRAWPVLVHQLLAMSLASDGVQRDDAWEHLRRVPDFAGIHRAEYDRLVAWMVRDASLREASGLLVLGPKSEKKFGRRNFMELFAVFSSPTTYTVLRGGGEPVGTLQQDFVDGLVEDVSCFLLGGRAWVPVEVSHSARSIVVQPAPRGKTPTWGGYLPQFLGLTVCQKTRQILTSDVVYPYLHASAAEVLRERREAFAEVLEAGGVEDDGREIRWWTFAGGRINATLKYAVEAAMGDYKVIADNHCVTVRSGEDDPGLRQAFERARERLGELEFWEDEQLWKDVGESLPNYRLSKFQGLVPPWVEREMVAGHLLDVAGAWGWVSGGDDAGLERVPHSLRAPTGAVPTREVDAPPEVTPTREVVWVDTADGLREACASSLTQSVVGLDVETTLRDRTLCLVQIACAEQIYLIDALEIADLSPLAELLESETVTKLIHMASFERSVFARHDMGLAAVEDTLTLSRQARGRDAQGGHSLKAVCRRELGIELDKQHQTSDWTRRPLSPAQLAYAAVDAEVLLALWPGLRPESGGRPAPTSSLPCSET